MTSPRSGWRSAGSCIAKAYCVSQEPEDHQKIISKKKLVCRNNDLVTSLSRNYDLVTSLSRNNKRH